MTKFKYSTILSLFLCWDFNFFQKSFLPYLQSDMKGIFYDEFIFEPVGIVATFQLAFIFDDQTRA